MLNKITRQETPNSVGEWAVDDDEDDDDDDDDDDVDDGDEHV